MISLTEQQAIDLLNKIDILTNGMSLILSDGIPYLAGVIVGSITALGCWLCWK